MLVLSRKVGEAIKLGDDITVVVTAIKGGRVRLGVEAPKDVVISRGELPSTEIEVEVGAEESGDNPEAVPAS